ncbi:hypothetical protein AMAG_06590 [Allomyces macrogynus ATCC 38327]|uniref:Uncharacterized protein n=1 Tax=Allomyces macrogynus (strain ATCC 38327) TaxID=578462 RepID=A0A0L0SEG9_ALLM3|nr:hypothetical protein AMAG_06590 [Allomyces macrogynus ATCC 38327]|eukprot:KNE60824.1 hypothetical protein AMAG_06590 [Allomyces macrogynus ATCC 38327]
MNCGARFLEFADLLAHIQSAHQYRLVTCPNSSCNMVLSSEHLRHHWDRHPACLHAIWPRRATDAAIDALLRDVYGQDGRSASPPHAQASARAPVPAVVTAAQQPAAHVVHHASNSSLHSDYSGHSQDSGLARVSHLHVPHHRHPTHRPVQLPPIHTVVPDMLSPPPPPPLHHQGPLPPVSMLVADEGIAMPPGPPRTPTYLDHASA